jgi:transposase
VQGYNAQAVVTQDQIVVAAELTQDPNDVQQLHPMLNAVEETLAAADIPDRPATVLADSGYWSIANLTAIPAAPELLVWPAKTGRTGKPRKDGQPSASKSDGLRAATFAKLSSERGKACYAKRKHWSCPAVVDTSTLGTAGPRRGVHVPRTRPPYPPEFGAEAVRLVRSSGKLIGEVAGDLGVSEQTLRNWVRQGDLDDGRRTDGLTTVELEELRQLRRRVRVLEQEREILKKAAAFFGSMPG